MKSAWIQPLVQGAIIERHHHVQIILPHPIANGRAKSVARRRNNGMNTIADTLQDSEDNEVSSLRTHDM